MHESTRLKAIESSDEVLHHFITDQKPPEDREHAVVRRGIEICRILTEGKHTAAEVADKLKLHSNTAFEYINAFSEGGIPISKASEVRGCIGRPESVFWIEEDAIAKS